MSDGAMRMKTEGKGTNSAVGSVKRHISRENRTGIPQQLKERMEQNTGLSFDNVRVHYNSSLPKKLDALAYTKGNQVEIGPGQERHLPHELGHVVQQKLGLVRANAMHPSGAALNTDAGLERQADEIGAGKKISVVQRMKNNVVQRCGGSVFGGTKSKELNKVYDVGEYQELKCESGMNRHHIGQKAVMKKLVSGYDESTGPAIIVPAVGHTFKGTDGIVSRNSSGFRRVKDLVDRDIEELKRVYSKVPQPSVDKLIDLNSTKYKNQW